MYPLWLQDMGPQLPAEQLSPNCLIEQQLWNYIFATIPKIIFFLGFDLAHFNNFGHHIKFTQITLNKIRMICLRFNIHPLEYLFYVFNVLSISPGHFIQTIFSYMTKINTMSQWRAYIIANKFPQIYFSFLPQ